MNLFGLSIAIWFAGSLMAADVSGIWTGHTVDRNGDPQDVSFRFTQSAGVITGKMYGDNESTPISEGTVSGDAIRFVIVTELNGQIARTIYSGHLISSKDGSGDEIEMSRAREGASASDGKPKPPPFRLRRVT